MVDMAIDDKPTAAWKAADLQELCDERRREQPNLEFKQELSLERDSDKAAVEHDVEGLANSGGGHIIYGLEEGDAGDGSKVAVRLLPLADGGLYERLNNLLDSRGDPRIPFEIYAIPAASGGIYLVVEVHAHRGPHMANDKR
jgi:predicted HTH transcriptional regulator